MNGRTSSAACCALRIFDAATICIARVICEVLPIDLMRRRMSRALATSAPGADEPVGRRFELAGERIAQRLLPRDALQEIRPRRRQELGEARLVFLDALDRHLIHVAVLDGPEQR